MRLKPEFRQQPEPIAEPVSDEMLDRTLGPLPEPQHHPLPANFEAKREAELEKMREEKTRANGYGALLDAKPDWQPDPRVTSALGLKGSTVEELAAELTAPVEDLNAALLDMLRTDEIAMGDAFLERERDPHLVPLEAQLTEEEENAAYDPFVSSAAVQHEEDLREQPQSLLQQVTPLQELDLTAKRPWREWPDPEVYTAPLHAFNLAADENNLCLFHGTHLLGSVSDEALNGLGRRCGFPPDFVGKLSPALAAQVINERIRATRDADTSVLIQDEEWIGSAPAHRGLVPYRQACDVAYEVLRRYYDPVKVESLSVNGALALRLLTPVVYPVTPQKGDELAMGIDLQHNYNAGLEVSLYTKRLVCLNGMTANAQAFSWRQRTEGGSSAEKQIEWLEYAVLSAIGTYQNLIDRAKQMAETRFEGEYPDVLRERAAAMGLPKRHLPALIEAYESEAGDTEWSLANAFSRLATHGGIAVGEDMQASVGNWISAFDLCTARLPRPIANRVGARILDES